MKRIFRFMIFAGVLVAIATAGGSDSGIIGIERILIQSVISVLLIATGSMCMERSADA